MAPPLPPKPTVGPLVRRTLFAAALTAGACGPKEHAVRIGPPPPRIGPHEPPPYVYEPDAAVPMAADAGPALPPPIRIGPPPPPPPRIGPPVRIGPEAFDASRSSLIRGVMVDDQGRPLARTSLRVTLPSGARIVATDAAGNFQIDGLPPGDHAAVIEAAGFAPVTATLSATREPSRGRYVARQVPGASG